MPTNEQGHRNLLTAGEQIAFLRNQGVRFDIISEAEAEAFLSNRNFFFKVKAFDKCFSRFGEKDPRYEKFINLDFAYLVEMTQLDHLLRTLIISMSLDVEHYMKVAINRSMMDEGADPYAVVDSLLDSDRAKKLDLLMNRIDISQAQASASTVAECQTLLLKGSNEDVVDALVKLLHLSSDLLGNIDPSHLERGLSQLGDSAYSRELAAKYGHRGSMAYWNFMELASFGGIVALYKHWFYELSATSDSTAKSVKSLLFPTRTLRNASAHNTNVLATLTKRLSKPVGLIAQVARDEYGIDPELVALTKRMPIVHDFTALLRCYELLVLGNGARQQTSTELQTLANRFAVHKDYFTKQVELKNGIDMLQDLMLSAANKLNSAPAE